MMPLCAPTKLFSENWQIFAISGLVRVVPACARTATATATSTEAEELNPEPSGTVPRQRQVEALGTNPSLFQGPKHAGRVVAPMAATARRQMLQVNADLLVKIDGVNICGRIASRAKNGNGSQIERSGHDKAFAGICMFADEIDATRRLISDASACQNACGGILESTA